MAEEESEPLEVGRIEIIKQLDGDGVDVSIITRFFPADMAIADIFGLLTFAEHHVSQQYFGYEFDGEDDEETD